MSISQAELRNYYHYDQHNFQKLIRYYPSAYRLAIQMELIRPSLGLELLHGVTKVGNFIQTALVKPLVAQSRVDNPSENQNLGLIESGQQDFNQNLTTVGITGAILAIILGMVKSRGSDNEGPTEYYAEKLKDYIIKTKNLHQEYILNGIKQIIGHFPGFTFDSLNGNTKQNADFVLIYTENKSKNKKQKIMLFEAKSKSNFKDGLRQLLSTKQLLQSYMMEYNVNIPITECYLVYTEKIKSQQSKYDKISFIPHTYQLNPNYPLVKEFGIPVYAYSEDQIKLLY